MPYFGVKVETEKLDIIVKLHGPLDTIVINTQQLKGVVDKVVEDHFNINNRNNVPNLCFQLVDDIKENYLNGNDLIWVEVEVTIKSNGVIFGASAEKIHEECLQ